MISNRNSHNRLALQKFKSNFWGVLSFWIIILLFILSLGAFFIIPDKSKNANSGDLALHSKSPGFSVKQIRLPQQSSATVKDYFIGRTDYISPISIDTFFIDQNNIYYQPFSNGIQRTEMDSISLDLWPTNTPLNKIITDKTFYLGTDNQGRDFLSRLVLGSRVSLSIGFVAVSISLLIGVTLGSIAGYYGGKIDALILWIINIFWTIPTLLLVIAITLALGKGFWQVFIAVGLTMWVEVARVIRGQIISIKQQQYIIAARALGYSDFRIMAKHILPNTLSPIIVICAANFASAILMESGLSFLGLGTQIPTPSWGSMIKENYNYILVGKAYLALFPGFAMFVVVVSFMMIGNALRDALDVKSK